MLYRITSFVALGLAALSALTVSSAEERSSAVGAIVAAYHKEEAAISRKDLKAVTALYTTGFTDIDETGDRSDLAGTRKRMRLVFQMMTTLTLQRKPQKFIVEGSQAIVSGVSHLEGRLFDPRKHAHRVVMEGAFVDVWVRTDRGWLKRESRSLSAHTLFDGKKQ